MRIGDLFKARERHLYPTKEDILQREIASALTSFENAGGDEKLALALLCSSLRECLALRTWERDRWRAWYYKACGSAEPKPPHELMRQQVLKDAQGGGM